MRAPAIGERWEARRLLALVAAVSVAAAMLLMYAGVARADHVPPDDIVAHNGPAGTNDAPYWETYLASERGITDATCTKINDDGDAAFVMPMPAAGTNWVLLVVKQATDNYVYYDPTGGHTYPSTGENAPGFSHTIVCSVVADTGTTTTTMATTTSSVDQSTTSSVDQSTTSSVDQSTTSSVDQSTTSSVDQSTTSSVDQSTTSSVDQSTTSSVDQSTTSSVDQSTTSSVDQSTTSSEDTTTSTDPDEVMPTVVTTAADEVDDDELPFTGLESEMMAALAVIFIAGGAALVAITRRAEDN